MHKKNILKEIFHSLNKQVNYCSLAHTNVNFNKNTDVQKRLSKVKINDPSLLSFPKS